MSAQTQQSKRHVTSRHLGASRSLQ